jgi:hypothetical protein
MGWSFDRPSFSLSYESQVLPCRAMLPAMGTQLLLWLATAISFYLRDFVSAPLTALFSAPVTRRGDLTRFRTCFQRGFYVVYLFSSRSIVSLFFSHGPPLPCRRAGTSTSREYQSCRLTTAVDFFASRFLPSVITVGHSYRSRGCSGIVLFLFLSSPCLPLCNKGGPDAFPPLC